ncbi:MAG: hypothetical protein QFX35_06260, partial [Candidatus Verstraetearchaeota archaeon]|nr:hypothetical protein [Candidatus Verstraetearchaeota archaeon]
SRRGMGFHFLGWNQLGQAGASMLHPHFQVLAGRRPASSLARCLELGDEYMRREGKAFWADLLDTEAGSPRFIGRTGGFSWVAPWSPLGSCELIGVHEGGSASILNMGENEVASLADGICRALRGMWRLGRTSVSMGIYSLPAEMRSESFRLHVRLMARSQRPVCDRAFLEVYGGEVGLAEAPEMYAQVMRSFF